MEEHPSAKKVIKKILIGGERDLQDKTLFHAVSLTAFLAWVGMGADGLTSSCYGPEEAFLVLIISTSYTQIIQLFPTGGGGYLVASKLLSPTLGMVSGCALLIDYVLTIALSISSGADALFSFLPAEWYSFRLAFAAAGVLLLTIMNMRGVRESVTPLIPIMLVFMVTHIFAIGYAFATHAGQLTTVAGTSAHEISRSYNELGLLGMFLLLMRSYAMGAGTYTGIEAVSNGLPVIREPRVENGKKTMHYMAVSLAFFALGLMVSYLLYEVQHTPGKTLNAVLFESITGHWPSGLASTFVTVTLVSEAAFLFVAAQTGFLDGPRVLANMALDRWFPSRFSMLSDRLVTQNGILLMGSLAMILVLLTRGSVAFLIVLYSITVFITFALSQLGMVRHWWQERRTTPNWRHRLSINGIGLVLTSFILVNVSIMKFHDGGWLTLLVTGLLVGLALLVKRHYRKTSQQLKRLDDLLVTAVEASETAPAVSAIPAYDPNSGTAIILVNGFGGLGLHTLMTVIRQFNRTFKNFVFVQVGVVDSGNFKGRDEVDRLYSHLQTAGEKYVRFTQHAGFYAESAFVVGVDVVEELDKLIPGILERFPGAIMFGGQLVFSEEYLFTRWLHNHTIFAVQKRFYHQGIPIVILPIRV